MATVAWKAVEGYWVIVHTSAAPDDAEWTTLLADMRKGEDLRRARIFVYTDGGAPNARQRQQLNQLLADAKPPIAVLTASSTARAVGVAISWFNPTIRLFPPHESERALDHLDASALDRVRLRSALAELKAKVGC